MAMLLRRADEERIATAARARSGRREARVLQGLVSHDYGAVAAAAMALILARGRRRDRFGQCLIGFDDLPEASAEHLVQAVSAGLRRELAAARGPSMADAELTQASDSVLEAHDSERSIESLTAALVHFLDEGGGLTDDLILAAAHEGEIGFVAEVLARRGGVASDSAMDELLSGDAKRLMGVLRVAGASRGLSAGLLGGIGDLLGIGEAGEAIAWSLEGWTERAPAGPRLAAILGGGAEAETGGARNEWAADEELRIISLSPDLAELLGVDPDSVAGQPLTRVVRLEEDDSGEMPLISALAARRGFSGQHARSRSDENREVILTGEVVTGADNSFAGFRGSVQSNGVAPASVQARTHAFDHALDEVLRSPLDRIIES